LAGLVPPLHRRETTRLAGEPQARPARDPRHLTVVVVVVRDYLSPWRVGGCRRGRARRPGTDEWSASDPTVDAQRRCKSQRVAVFGLEPGTQSLLLHGRRHTAPRAAGLGARGAPLGNVGMSPGSQPRWPLCLPLSLSPRLWVGLGEMSVDGVRAAVV